MRYRRKKGTGSAAVMYAGAIALIVSLCVCMGVFSYLRNRYVTIYSHDIDDEHLSLAKELGKHISESAEELKKGVIFVNSYSGDTREVIRYITGELARIGELKHVCFVGRAGEMWLDGENPDRDMDIDKVRLYRTLKQLDYGEDNAYIGGVTPETGKLLDTDVLASTPVEKDGEVIGYMLAGVKEGRVFDAPAFEREKKKGECIITDMDGMMLVRSGGILPENTIGDSFRMNVQDVLVQDENNRLMLTGLSYALSKGQSGHVMVKTTEGFEMQICYCPVEGVPGLCFIFCAEPGLADELFRPLLAGSVGACILIMTLMLFGMMMVWVHGKKTNLTIEKLAYEDPVTKGWNLSYFKDYVPVMIASSPALSYSIYRFDITNFRYINESYGHTKADQILASCIRNFSEIFTENELCVRMNADQFLALVLNDSKTEKKIASYHAAVNADARGNNVKYPIRFKTGVYHVRKSDTDVDMMIDHANVARKSLTKENKEMCEVYSEHIVEGMRKIDRIESLMHKALAELEFKVYIQAKWDIINDHVCGGEALVRWCRPDGAIIPPDSFIPIFENNGFVEQLDFYMLESVCSMIKECLEAGDKVWPVSVNQSRLLLHSPDYVDNVAGIIRRYRIPPELIQLEITESVFEDGRDEMIRIVKELKKLGVGVAMDDFGSGYSSLNVLKDVPFDVIKIDREFFADTSGSDDARVILVKIIDMVKELGKDVICEGVEDAAQVEFLRSIGCGSVQGYYYSRPVPALEFIRKYFKDAKAE